MLNYGSFAQGKTPALSNHLVSLKTWLMLRLCQQTVRADLNILLLSKSVAGLDYCNPHHLGMYYWLGYWPISSPSLVHKSYETDNMGNVIPYAPVTSKRNHRPGLCLLKVRGRKLFALEVVGLLLLTFVFACGRFGLLVFFYSSLMPRAVKQRVYCRRRCCGRRSASSSESSCHTSLE